MCSFSNRFLKGNITVKHTELRRRSSSLVSENHGQFSSMDISWDLVRECADALGMPRNAHHARYIFFENCATRSSQKFNYQWSFHHRLYSICFCSTNLLFTQENRILAVPKRMDYDFHLFSDCSSSFIYKVVFTLADARMDLSSKGSLGLFSGKNGFRQRKSCVWSVC